MNKGAVTLIWAGVTVLLTVIAALLVNPAVFLGTIIGVATTTMRDLTD